MIKTLLILTKVTIHEIVAGRISAALWKGEKGIQAFLEEKQSQGSFCGRRLEAVCLHLRAHSPKLTQQQKNNQKKIKKKQKTKKTRPDSAE